MHYIAHRINTVEELRDLPREHGAEVDLRDRGERLILQHDPFKDGEDFEPWPASYRHGTLILNIKSERIEPKVQGTTPGSLRTQSSVGKHRPVLP